MKDYGLSIIAHTILIIHSVSNTYNICSNFIILIAIILHTNQSPTNHRCLKDSY